MSSTYKKLKVIKPPTRELTKEEEFEQGLRRNSRNPRDWEDLIEEDFEDDDSVED